MATLRDDALRQEQPFGQPVLGDIADPGRGRRNGSPRGDRPAVQRDRPAIRRDQPEQRLGQRGAARPEQARDAQHLARAQGEADIRRRRLALCRPAHVHQFAGSAGQRLRAAAPPHRVRSCAGSALAASKSRRRAFGHLAAVAQHDDLFADLQHFGQLVADEQHRHAVGLQPADDRRAAPAPRARSGRWWARP